MKYFGIRCVHLLHCNQCFLLQCTINLHEGQLNWWDGKLQLAARFWMILVSSFDFVFQFSFIFFHILIHLVIGIEERKKTQAEKMFTSCTYSEFLIEVRKNYVYKSNCITFIFFFFDVNIFQDHAQCILYNPNEGVNDTQTCNCISFKFNIFLEA